ncbi:MAG: ABC transporter ATP-binding protein [Flaviflexus sp.]|nr:ABC transporter ATP-binding protein [Flaviflexus sp.]
MNDIHAFELAGVAKRYGSVRAADGINLSARPGEVIALLGPNGAGKTTTIDIALGLIAPDAGKAQLFGMSPRAAIRRSLVGVVQQSDSLNPELRVNQLLSLVAATHPRAIAPTAALELAGITHLARARIATCSGGERQRVRLALALLGNPLLLVLDEPTTGMDVEARESFWSFMDEWAAEGRTIVFATHYLAEAQQHAQRTIIMAAGRVLADGPTSELRRNYAHSHLRISYDCSDERALTALTGLADKITARAGALHAEGADLDEAARAALSLPGARGLEVAASSLEDAYLHLVEGALR